MDFHTDGYLVLPGLASAEYVDAVYDFAQTQLQAKVGPVELEIDTGYPGAPTDQHAAGADTVRRLLQVVLRDRLITDWATGSTLAQPLKQLLGEQVRLSQVHHNCIMTKQPRYSSLTGWHRDSRYWHFARAELISVWLALRAETVENGCLLVIPGSHRWQIAADALDAAQFLRTDLAANAELLAQAIPVPLNPGDVLFFSSNLFHAAGKNRSELTKFSMVFTYRALNNPPLSGTRSASLPELPL